MCLFVLLATRRSRCQPWRVELDQNGLQILSPVECVELLTTARIGRIAVSKNALPTIVPVLYGVDGATVTFHASGGLLAAAAERGDIVFFEADFANGSESELWSVVVVGKLELRPSQLGATEDAALKFGADMVSLPMTIVSGCAAMSVLEAT